MTEEKLYTKREVAELLRVDLQTVNRYIKQGKIRVVKLSRLTHRIKASEIAYLLGGTT